MRARGVFGLDPHNHLFGGRHDIECARTTQVDHDASNRRLGLEAADPDLKHVLGMHRDVPHGRPQHRIVEIQHQAIRILQQKWLR